MVVRPPVVLANGLAISIQASHLHDCVPPFPGYHTYSHVAVWLPGHTAPLSMVPVESINQLIEQCGGFMWAKGPPPEYTR